MDREPPAADIIVQSPCHYSGRPSDLSAWVMEKLGMFTQWACVVLSQLVCGRVGGVQPELWRRGTDAAGPVRTENQPEQCGRPGRLRLRSARSCQEADLQHAQLSPSLEHWAVVAGKHARGPLACARLEWCQCMSLVAQRRDQTTQSNNSLCSTCGPKSSTHCVLMKPCFDAFNTFYDCDLTGFKSWMSPFKTWAAWFSLQSPCFVCGHFYFFWIRF